MAKVKVVVTALRRYWAAGRCFEQGETAAELEESDLAQLDAAKGGVKLEQHGADRSNPEQKSPPVLTYRIVEDPPPAPVPPAEPAPAEQHEPDPERHELNPEE